MYMVSSYLLLGSNKGNKTENLKEALRLINKEIGSVEKKSKILETKPLGFDSENIFLNQLLLVKTQLSPIQLLNYTQHIEETLGRIDKTQDKNYTDREIDIDILSYDGVKFYSKNLQIPHYENLNNRPFVQKLFLNLSL